MIKFQKILLVSNEFVRIASSATGSFRPKMRRSVWKNGNIIHLNRWNIASWDINKILSSSWICPLIWWHLMAINICDPSIKAASNQFCPQITITYYYIVKWTIAIGCAMRKWPFIYSIVRFQNAFQICNGFHVISKWKAVIVLLMLK